MTSIMRKLSNERFKIRPADNQSVENFAADRLKELICPLAFPQLKSLLFTTSNHFATNADVLSGKPHIKFGFIPIF